MLEWDLVANIIFFNKKRASGTTWAIAAHQNELYYGTKAIEDLPICVSMVFECRQVTGRYLVCERILLYPDSNCGLTLGRDA